MSRESFLKDRLRLIVETKQKFTLVDYFDIRNSELQNLFLLII